MDVKFYKRYGKYGVDHCLRIFGHTFVWEALNPKIKKVFFWLWVVFVIMVFIKYVMTGSI